ncbi:DUF6691 family protein [Candidatus Nitrosacidococcus tergens]|uniref:YeeE/YedE family protein n=1 Tax=Candidatus Nitrosacidococcus tergens TaxID=553981 RepID=A0A7G1Q9P2_9GAMM|nr:DUF6691 family protein [Candidatus Nitrosacidococcus tergens]CAB1275911.1 conserved membrane protein of unknown function [Candidatus Nitrosacidococcus tergens]
MGIITSFLVGLIFGLGLLISGMVFPEKVLGFLDIKGQWDPSLALVMLGAVLVGFISFKYTRQRVKSFLGFDMKIPTTNLINARLILGSLIFGIGWGIAGLCPGPALVNLGFGEMKAIAFVIAMVVGMGIFEFKLKT